ncbi:hypothetical protein EON80_26735, partial [bacterium]
MGSITGGTGTLAISAGGTNQNLTLAASGTGQVQSSSILKVTNATASTSSTTGAFQVAGGMGVTGDIYAGTSINAGTQMMSPQIYGSSAASGTLKVDGTSNATKGNLLLNSAGGFVGIGTTTPFNPLWIHGGTNMNLGVRDGVTDLTAVRLHTFNDAASSFVPMEFGASKFNFITGSVGIGTTAPAAKLHVVGSSGVSTSPPAAWNSNSALIVDNAGQSFIDIQGGSTSIIGLLLQGTGSGGGSNGQLLYDNGTNKMSLGTNGTTRMTIDSSGGVGIGTTAPNAPLEVNGVIQSTNTYNSTGGTLSLNTPAKTGTKANTWKLFNMTSTSVNGDPNAYSDGLAFWRYLGNGTNAGPAMFLADGGNVGIGTTAPNLSGYGNGTYLTVAGNFGSTPANNRGGLELANMQTPAANNIAGDITFAQAANSGSSGVSLIRSTVAGTGGANGFGGSL